MMRTRRFCAVVALGLSSGALSGCAAMNQTEKGALIGTTAGAALGAVVGKQAGETSKGAIIGAAVGGVAGAIIGREIEAQARAMGDKLQDAKVEQDGEEVRITFDSGILFDTNSATLRGEALRNLEILAANLLEYPGYHVEVSGHTDSRGTAEHNRLLSERRAQAAAQPLVARGVAPERIRTVGHGLTQPIDSNDTEAGRQNNRRVEVKIYASDAYRQQVGQQR